MNCIIVVASRRLAFIEHPESPGRKSPDSAGVGQLWVCCVFTNPAAFAGEEHRQRQEGQCENKRVKSYLNG